MFGLVYIVLTVGLCVKFGFATSIATLSPISASDVTIQTTSANEETEALQSPDFRIGAYDLASRRIQVTLGSKFRITCGARGMPKPVVHFYKESKELLQKSFSNATQQRIDMQAATLRIFNATLKDSGKYKCVAVNSVGNKSLSFEVRVTDQETSLAISTPIDPRMPHWTKPKLMQKTLHAEPAGNTVNFKCLAEADDSGGAIKVDWYKDGTIIDKDKRVGGYKFRHKFQILSLESVVLSDVGHYKCVVHNNFGQINHTYELDVAERSAAKPIMQGLSNQTARFGSDVTFRCLVFSDAHPHVKWIRWIDAGAHPPSNSTRQGADLVDNYVVLKQAGINTTDADLQHLQLRNVTWDDAGKYTCLAGNSIGVSHISAWLTVVPEEDIETAEKVHILVYVFAAILCVIACSFCVYLVRLHYYKKDDQLVSIENPEVIPPMTKMEEPIRMFGNEQAWRRMFFPRADHQDITIPTDLQWELKRENILLRERIDEGFFGQVFRADLVVCRKGKREKIDGAVKMLKSTRTEKDMLDLLSEMDQMKRVGKHTNIINLLGICTQNGVLWLITEYAQEGSLRDFLRRNRPIDMQYHLSDPTQTHQPLPRDEPLTYKDLISASYQVARGMDYLAQKKCVHRDLAARNVLVTTDFVMKIADFGLARDVRSTEYYRKHTRGHLPYKWMALEAMTDNVFTHATDVWSFGVLLWEIFTLGGSPYPGIKTYELVRFLKQGERLEQPQFASPLLYRLMRDCWDENPNRRPRFRQLVEDLDRMLAESSSEDYIDLTVPCDTVVCSQTDTEESDIDEESSRDSANATGEDSDSVFEHPNQLNDDHVTYNSEDDPLLEGHVNAASIMCNEHARIQSDV